MKKSFTFFATFYILILHKFVFVQSCGVLLRNYETVRDYYVSQIPLKFVIFCEKGNYFSFQIFSLVTVFSRRATPSREYKIIYRGGQASTRLKIWLLARTLPLPSPVSKLDRR
jgi:hypothetical protein